MPHTATGRKVGVAGIMHENPLTSESIKEQQPREASREMSPLSSPPHRAFWNVAYHDAALIFFTCSVRA